MTNRNSAVPEGLSFLLILTVPILLTALSSLPTYSLKILFLLPVLIILFWQTVRIEQTWRTPQFIDLAAIPILTLLTLALGWFFSWLSKVDLSYSTEKTGLLTILAILLAVIEELYFRSWLMRKLIEIGLPGSLSGGFSVLLFGFMHLWQGWQMVIYACIIGLIYTLIIIKRKCLLTLICAHSLHNICSIQIGTA